MGYTKDLLCQKGAFVPNYFQTGQGEHSGSVVECLACGRVLGLRPRVPSSLASLGCVLEQDTLILA